MRTSRRGRTRSAPDADAAPSDPTPAPSTSPPRSPSASPPTERVVSWAVSVLLVAASFAQEPGRILPETKLDIALDPLRYLGRALSAWDPSAGFGRVQNQAVGYLFPMGPFYAVGDGLGVPAWITQRLWIGALLVAGYLGVQRLAGALGVTTVAGRAVAGLAYTLAGASLTTVAFQSAGQLPYVLAPWVLLPLVTADDERGPRRAAARSGLAVALMGGVNGAATLAVLPLALLWFTTRAAGPDRRRLFGWWVAAVAAATLWWVVALAVSVRYGLRFTAYTEQSVVTTSTESATELWRGTGNWLAHLDSVTGRWLPGSWSIVSAPAAVVASLAAAAAGAVGLARRDAPGRAWLLPAALLGTAVMGAGYAGDAGGSLGPTVQTLLDGPLVVFRNVHKFSAVVRLPLAVGLGHLVAVAATRRSPTDAPEDRRVRRTLPAGAAALATIAVVVAGFPLATGALGAPGSFDNLPDAWREAAAWVDDHGGGHDRTLLLPGAAFAEDTWGRPLDEPWGVLAEGDWAVRDLIPLGGTGSTRLLDGLDQALAGDHLPPGFVTTLQRAGIGHLVVRNDLDLSRTTGPDPTTMRRLLATAPELERVAAFGPVLDPPDTTSPATRRVTDDLRISPVATDLARDEIRQIEVYAVPDPAPVATAYPADRALVIGGGPEALVDLPPALVQDRATYLATDGPTGADAPVDPIVVATDTARRRDVDFGSVRDAATYTLEADQASPFGGRTPRDRWPDGGEEEDTDDLTVAVLEGAASLSTNSTESAVGPEHQPFAAFDGDPTSTWEPSRPVIGRWLQVDLDRPRAVPSVSVRIPASTGERIRTVAVTTDGGTRSGEVGLDGTATIATAPGDTATVRITVEALTAGRVVAPVGLAEVALEGVTIRRPLRTPAIGPAAVASLDRSPRDRYDLLRTDEEAALDRIVDLADADDWALSGTAGARPGRELDDLVAAATASPSADSLTVVGGEPWRGRPELGPTMALDGDPTTAWVNEPRLTPPSLVVSWDGPVTVDRITITPLAAGTTPIRSVNVTIGGGTLTRDLPASGVIAIPPTRTDTLTLTFTAATAGSQRVGVAEVAIGGLEGRTTPAVDRAAAVDLACGEGPELTVDGTPVPTRARTTVGDLLTATPIPWSACEPVTAAGETRITGPASGAVQIDSLLAGSTAAGAPDLDPDPAGSGSGSGPGPGAPGAGRAVTVESWGADERRVTIAAGDAAVLTTTENGNDGWEATLDGRTLTPVRVDGWRQGFLVPAGEGGRVTLRYAPSTTHRVGLALGALGLVVLLVGAAAGPRRRRPWSAPDERAWGDLPALATGVVVGLLLGGPVVLLLGLLLLVPQRDRRLPWVLVAGLVGAGAVVLAAGVDPGAGRGSFSTAAQVLATVAWLALAAALVPADWPRPRPTASPEPAEPEAPA